MTLSQGHSVILSDLAKYSVTRSTRCLFATAELLVQGGDRLRRDLVGNDLADIGVISCMHNARGVS